jgi:hypothetical protein
LQFAVAHGIIVWQAERDTRSSPQEADKKKGTQSLSQE